MFSHLQLGVHSFIQQLFTEPIQALVLRTATLSFTLCNHVPGTVLSTFDVLAPLIITSLPCS